MSRYPDSARNQLYQDGHASILKPSSTAAASPPPIPAPPATPAAPPVAPPAPVRPSTPVAQLHPGMKDASPSHAMIAARAFELYNANGRVSGHCAQNWLNAEHELKHSVTDQAKATAEASSEMTSEGAGGSIGDPNKVVPRTIHPRHG